MHLDSNTSVYLTGGTGFVGSHLRSALTDRDVPVTLLAREGESVQTHRTEQVEHGDVTTPETPSLSGHDVVIHLAAQTSIEAAIEEPSATWGVNADGTLHVLEAAREASVDRFLYASTASVYGLPTYLPIDESHPTNPAEPYGASKLAGDGLARSYASSYNLDTIVARIFNAFGPRQPTHNVVPSIISQALDGERVELGNLSPARDFIYVRDVVDALITILEQGDPGTPYNIGRGDSVSVGEMAELVANEVDHDIDVVSTADRQRSDDVEIPKHVADISRLRRLGWKPKYDVSEAIQETVERESELSEYEGDDSSED